jgi:hypothetical protein
MTYTNKSIKKYKGKLIELTYQTLISTNTLTGEITASTRKHILFDTNKSGNEISLKYDQLIKITELNKDKDEK